MQDQRPSNDRRVSSELHPAVYAALIGAAAWFAIAIWGFARDSYTGWLLVVVSAFALIAVGIPAIMSRVGGGTEKPKRQRFRDWASGDFATWTGRSNAANAAVEILLPLGSIAFGMTAIAIIFMAEHA
jgi:hypothetical protein